MLIKNPHVKRMNQEILRKYFEQINNENTTIKIHKTVSSPAGKELESHHSHPYNKANQIENQQLFLDPS